jgi:DNA-binding SARP family transcriptional activator
MSELRLSLLGPPSIACDGAPLDLHRHKNVALLAYLAVGGMSPGRQRHTREALVTLLWPELEPSRARAGLRRNLSALRKVPGGACLEALEEAVALYRGDFLEGFSLPDSAQFDDWGLET